jgi:hypothetical protein
MARVDLHHRRNIVRQIIVNTPLGKLPVDLAEVFLFHNPTVRAGSMTTSGLRRLYTHETGEELDRLLRLVAEVGGVPLQQIPSPVSIPVLSPGVKDLSPCVPCQATHNVEWANLPATTSEFRNILAKMVTERNYEFPPVPKLSGNGIVTVGGGKYWAGIVVSIKMLRETGCTLPVEVWHRGDMEPVRPEDVADCGDVRFVDTYAHAALCGGARILGGWEAKVWAIANTTFARILFLDADAYCLEDPTKLIESLEGTEPLQYWEDTPNQRTSIDWDKVWQKTMNTVPTVQGGQLLIDRSRCWKLLCIVQWMNQHSDFYYRHMFGDQDTYRVALEAIGDSSLWRCLSSVKITNKVLICSHDGKPFIIHRTGSKLFAAQWREGNGQVWDGIPDLTIPGESRMAAHYAAMCVQ